MNHQIESSGHGRPARKPGMRRYVLALAVIAVVCILFGAWSRWSTYSTLKKRASDVSIPRVQIINPENGPARRDFTLPGTMHAWFEAPLYAQVTGYVSAWNKDYGATVKRGDLLATIDSPTLDAQYGAAQASLDVANARYRLALVTARRWQSLTGTKAVSQQEIDVQIANAAVAKSQVDEAQRNLERFAAQENFKNIVAPFDGIVTARLTDVGDYVSGTGGDMGARGAAQLFTVSDTHRMRIFVSVPQNYSDILKPGLSASFTLPQRPGKTYQASFLTSANSVGTQTRTVTTELTIDNPQRDLWPGNYVSVRFSVPGDPDILILPQQSVLFRAQGMQVAVVDEQNHVHLKNIKLGLNLGNKIQVTDGISKDDRVIANPSAGLLDGQEVKIVQPVAGYNGPSATPPAAAPEAGAGSGTRK